MSNCAAHGYCYQGERFPQAPAEIRTHQADLQLQRLSRRDGTLSDALLAEIGRLRVVSWEAYGKRSVFASTWAAGWTDSHDEHATHFVIISGRMVIGAARQCVHIGGESLPDAEDLGNYTNAALWPAAF